MEKMLNSKMANKWLVCIRCMTFNHSAYIKDALDGFCMQQTTFPFYAVVFDDASTDGEQEIIKSYMDAHFDCSLETGFKRWETKEAFYVFARHKENVNCHFLVVYLKKNLYKTQRKVELIKEWCNAKYIALCEGDDYWTDPLKLQKQVDFLETHPDFSMCIHGADVKNESKREVWAKCETIETREYFSKDVFPDWVVPTASIVYRREVVDKYPFKHWDWVRAGDIVLILKGMHTGRVWGMAEHMSVYRMNDGSLSGIPATIESRAAMCKHYEALMGSFPQVDKEFCYQYIASFNYSRFRLEKKWTVKLKHLYIAIKTSPKYVFRKFWRAVTNGK